MSQQTDSYPRCKTCGRRKKPIGRDAGIGIDSWCYLYRDGDGCEGYYQDPQPVQHWPGELREDSVDALTGALEA